MPKKAFGPSAMFFEGNRPLLMPPLPQPQTPTQRQRQQAEQLADAFRRRQVRVFEIEPATFQTAKQGFNLPSLGRVIQRRFRGIRRDQDQQIIFDPHADDEHGHAPDASRPKQKSGFPHRTVLKKAERGHLTGAAGIGHARIPFDPNAKPDALPFEKFDPVGPDKFAVSRQTLNPLMPKFE